ncbi:uncharacterized protein METZ01_LOCUS496476, partial [marine metagenome]
RAFKSSIVEMANTEPLTLENLPSEIRDRFTGKNNKFFKITVYPEKNIWEEASFMYSFIDEVSALSENTTGLPFIFVEFMDIMSQEGKKATYLAIIAIFLVLLIDFSSFKYALLSMAPMTLGVVWMIGVMELSGLQFTIMTLLVIPLIISLGIDNGVHILKRWQIENNLENVYRSTGKPIILMWLSFMLGSVSLWYNTLRGLSSMGISLFIGVVTCCLATIFIVPIILGLRYKE